MQPATIDNPLANHSSREDRRQKPTGTPDREVVDGRQETRKHKSCEVDLRNVASVYCRMLERLEEAPLPPVPCRLILCIPPDHYHWLWSRDEGFRSTYIQGLQSFVDAHQSRQELPLVPLELVEGDSGWDVFVKCGESSPTSIKEEKQFCQGWFIIPHPDQPQWVLWSHDVLPRLPTKNEGQEDSSLLDSVLEGLKSDQGERWHSEEQHRVCGLEVYFHERSRVR